MSARDGGSSRGGRSPSPNAAAMTRRDFLAGAAAAAGVLATPWANSPAFAAAAATRPADEVPDEDRRKVEAAIPSKAPAKPRKARKLLIFDLNIGYGGHPSIRTANLAFTLMGRKTGAFETVVSHDPAVFKPESLRQFDAVFLNNTVGNLFEDPALRGSLVDFVYGGGGLMGVHGTTVAFTRWPEGAKEDWPEFGIMLGARGANHRAADEHVFIKLDDPGHPVNHAFGGEGFDYRSEFFRVHEAYSRNRDRVLFSIDTAKTDMNQGPAYGKLVRTDSDYALAWVRAYGRGRVFHCTIAHAPSVFWDPKLLEFYLAAAQFALGDLAAPTTPSAKLTPAVRAQEKLGWRLGLEAWGPGGKDTLAETCERAGKLGLLYVEGRIGQPVSKEFAAPFGPALTDDQRRAVRLVLDAAGVRLLTCAVPQMPADPTECRALWDFARRMGIEALVATPPPAALETVEKLCQQLDVALASRHTVVPLRGLDAGQVEQLVQDARRLAAKPVIFGVDCPSAEPEAMASAAKSIDWFNAAALRAAK
jgi:type 1 glutamine amidotransferase